MGLGGFLKKVLNPKAPLKQLKAVTKTGHRSLKAAAKGKIKESAKLGLGSAMQAGNPLGSANPLQSKLNAFAAKRMGLGAMQPGVAMGGPAAAPVAPPAAPMGMAAPPAPDFNALVSGMAAQPEEQNPYLAGLQG